MCTTQITKTMFIEPSSSDAKRPRFAVLLAEWVSFCFVALFAFTTFVAHGSAQLDCAPSLTPLLLFWFTFLDCRLSRELLILSSGESGWALLLAVHEYYSTIACGLFFIPSIEQWNVTFDRCLVLMVQNVSIVDYKQILLLRNICK